MACIYIPGPIIGKEGGKDWLRVIEIYPGDTCTNQLRSAGWEKAGGYLNELGSARKEEGGTDAGEGEKNHFELF